MGSDFEPYWCRTGDVIDLDGPYQFGNTVDLVELPVSWVLDDFPHFEFYRSESGTKRRTLVTFKSEGNLAE